MGSRMSSGGGGGGGGGSGTVTSVALTVPTELSVSGSPVTSAGTLAVTKATATANRVYAGPTSGGAAQPTMRALVAADVGAVNPSALTGSGTVPAAGLPAATTSALGAVQVGTGLAVDGAGLLSASGTAGLYSAYLCYQDQKTAASDGGTFTSGAWQTRTLTTEVADTAGHGSLASNQITLDAGTYRVLASAPAYAAGHHQTRLYNITAGAQMMTGTSEYCFAGDDTQSRSFVSGRFTLAAPAVIELQHRCSVSATTYGLGVAAGWTTEVYAVVELFKE